MQHTPSPNNKSIKIISLNARGLNIPEKRSQLLLSMHKNKADIVFLQETHFRTSSIPKLSNYRFPTSIHASNNSTKSKGVSLLFAKNCPFHVTDTCIDSEARYLFVKGTLHGKRLTLANIYAPNTKQVPFFRSTLRKLTLFQDGILILGGDFNVPLNPLHDTSTGSSSLPYSALRAIKSQLTELSLHDSWRTLHPNEKDFTFFSTPHNRYSRLDYLFISQRDLPMLTTTTIDPMYLSDHHPISMTLAFSHTQPRHHIWRLDPSLLTDTATMTAIQQRLLLYFKENDSPEISPMMRWEAHKSTIRGELIALSAKRRKDRQTHINTLTSRIQALEAAHKSSMAATSLPELLQARSELLEALNKQTKRNYILSQKIFYEYGNKSGKILARALHAKKAKTTIHSITDPTGNRLVSNDQIAGQFVNYYSQLYNLHPHDTQKVDNHRRKAIQDFLSNYCPQHIPIDEANNLERPITPAELDVVLKQLKPGKSPGPDGLTTGYYQTYIDILKPHFLQAFNSVSSGNPPPRDLLAAHVTVIPKPNKDASMVANYRPISLLNVDLKIYAKILANRLLPLLPNLISLDQVGFIPGREARDNTIKAINIHKWLTSQQQQGFFLSLDAEKAFDRVAWDYMEEVLKKIGIRERMLQFILALYASPTAQVRVNGHLSNAFSMSNGTRQGCPLSPLIFILTLEPLLQRLRANPDIKGVSISGTTYKLSAFADDILLFLTEPHISLPNLLKDLNTFNLLTNLQINFKKSEALNVSLQTVTLETCQSNFPFKWTREAITYLGIRIPTRLSDLYIKNYLPILQQIQKDLKSWSTGLFSWFGRTAILKMNILPRVLYVMQTVPIRLPKAFYASYRRACNEFIWGTNRPRLSFERLSLPKLKGGLALPDIAKYHQACQLSRIVDWSVHSHTKAWTQIENEFSLTPVRSLPWTPTRRIPQTCSQHPLISSTLQSFKSMCQKHHISSNPSPLTPIRNNADFPPGLHSTFLKGYWPQDDIRAKHFFSGNTFQAITNLPAHVSGKPFPSWIYNQIRHFLAHPPKNTDYSRQLTPFEVLCSQTEPQRHVISELYALLFSEHTPKSNIATRAWEKDLDLDLSDQEWENIYSYIHKGTINVSAQENGFKIFSRWYKTPLKLHKMSPSIPPTCWRCSEAEGSMVHLWWSCPLIQPFWKEVQRITTNITTYPIEYTPAQMLLHHSSISKKDYHRSLALHMLNAAKMCIPPLWKSTKPPTIPDWLKRISKIAEMEELIHQAKDTSPKFRTIWSCWQHFQTTPEYKDLLS